MKLFNWFKRRKMPRTNAQVQELFEVVGIQNTEEWKAIEICFSNGEMPPPELVYAAYQAFMSAKDRYAIALTQEAYAIREEIVLTKEAMMPEGDHE
jgi:hypothetical protein